MTAAMTSSISIPPSLSNPDRSNPPDLPAVASAVDRLTGEVARLRDDL